VTNTSIEALLDSATKARLVGNYEPGSEEWLALRQTGVGGSDVGAICGLNKWESPMSLWAKKTGLLEAEQPDSEAMEWGRRLEPVILAKFQAQHPELEVYYNPGTFAHPDREWQLANPDALAFDPATGRWSVIEIKTSRYEDEWDDKTGEVPPSYRAQVVWYLQTFGFRHGYVATLFSGAKYREFEISFDEFEADANLRRVGQWREYVTSGTMPDFDGAEATYNTVRAMHPEITPDSDVELGELGGEYLEATETFEQAEKDLRELKSRILNEMGDAKRGLINGRWAVTRQARGTTGLPYLVNKKG
jgi:putative phage-type endonuclease